MRYELLLLWNNFKLKQSLEFNDLLVTKENTSIYEVIRFEQGIPIFLEDHLNRLFHSADISNLAINVSYCDFEKLIEELIKKNNVTEGKIKLIIHFGKEEKSSEQDLLIYITPHYFPSAEEYNKGIKTGLCRTIRNNPNAKILDTEARKKANHVIAEERLFEVILINKEGVITEGSRSNVFFIKDNNIYTPPEKDVLNGITRRNVIKICRQNNINVIEKEMHFSELNQMESMFLTGTSIKVLPVNFLDRIDFSVNNGLLNRIKDLYDNSIKNYIESRINLTN